MSKEQDAKREALAKEWADRWYHWPGRGGPLDVAAVVAEPMSTTDDVNSTLKLLRDERDKALAALADSQAECVALHEARCSCGGYECRQGCALHNALSRPPGSREALRALLRSGVLATLDAAGDVDIPCQATGRATGCLSNDPDAVKACMERDREAFAEVIVARLLGEGGEHE